MSELGDVAMLRALPAFVAPSMVYSAAPTPPIGPACDDGPPTKPWVANCGAALAATPETLRIRSNGMLENDGSSVIRRFSKLSPDETAFMSRSTAAATTSTRSLILPTSRVMVSETAWPTAT